MKISIVIPNYNTWDLVKRNIDSLYKYDRDNFHEIIVVDDCSPKARPDDFFPIVKVIRNSSNLHYTKTVNAGLRAAHGDIIILLDSDAYLVMPICTEIKKAYSTDEQLACLGFDTVDDIGNRIDNFLYEPSWRSFLSGQQLHKLIKPILSYKGKKEYPFSCAVSFRKSAIEELGFFDESFPVLEADHDLSRRIHQHVFWKLAYTKSIFVYHVGGGSIPRNADRVLKFYQYRWQYLGKHNILPFRNLIKVLVSLRVLVELVLLYILSLFKKEMSYKVKGRVSLYRLISSLK